MVNKNILIVEDKKEVAQTLNDTVSTLGYNVTGCVTSLDMALENIVAYHPDLIFVDLELRNNHEGMKLGEIIYKELHTPYVFIVSNGCKSTIDVIKQTHPNGVLIYKQSAPFTAFYVQSTIELAFFDEGDVDIYHSNTFSTNKHTENELQDGLFIKTGDLYKKVMFKDILWLEGDDNYTIIYTNTRKFSIKKVLKCFMEILPTNKFFRVHKSYIIHLAEITGVNYKSVFLGNKVIPMSRQLRPKLMSMMNVI